MSLRTDLPWLNFHPSRVTSRILASTKGSIPDATLRESAQCDGALELNSCSEQQNHPAPPRGAGRGGAQALPPVQAQMDVLAHVDTRERGARSRLLRHVLTMLTRPDLVTRAFSMPPILKHE